MSSNDNTPIKSTAALEALKQGLNCGKLVVKIAASAAECEEVFRLRYRVFNEELGEGIPENAATGLDQDSFDEHCDHLMVVSDGKVVGTYRLLSGLRKPAAGFYSETEFNLKSLPYAAHDVVELGRGCIQPEFRRQTTLMALFWGIDRYMKAREARFLLGCASLPIMSAEDAEATYVELERMGVIDPTLGVKPLPANEFHASGPTGHAQIPQLVKFYIQFGAKILARPAYDPIFKVYDLLMAFDMSHLSEWGVELLNRFDKRNVVGTENED